MAKLHPQVQAEILRCAQDFRYYCETYLKIIDADGHLVPLIPNEAQLQFLEAIEANPRMQILKPRRVGFTTIGLAWHDWKARFSFLWQRDHKVLVTAQTQPAAEAIFQICWTFHKNLPGYLRFKLDKGNVREMRFALGGLIKVSTASGEGARGQGFNAVHMTEFAFYADPQTSIASILQTLPEDAVIIRESTANGINEAHRLWYADDGYYKLFVPWTAMRSYVSSRKPTIEIPQYIQDYARQHRLTKGQLYWCINTWAEKCGANWRTFNQEYPITAEVAFITSGDKFFDCSFPHVKATTGYMTYAEPQQWSLYAIGVDVAGGSESGDYSAFCVLDLTKKPRARIVATYYDHIAPIAFAERVKQEAEKWGALVVVERNNNGITILEYLQREEVPNLYHQMHHDKQGKKWTSTLGFNTSAESRPYLLSNLQAAIATGELPPDDPRLQAEINTFIWRQTSSGKTRPDHESNAYSDMIFATALAYEGRNQLDVMVQSQQEKKPQGIRERLEWELRNGKLYEDAVEQGYFADNDDYEDDCDPVASVLMGRR